MFNINHFNGNLNRNGGIAKQSHVEMTITPPSMVKLATKDDVNYLLSRNDIRNSTPYGLDWLLGRKNAVFSALSAEEGMRFRIDATEIPGRSIMTTQYTDYGLPRKIAYGSNLVQCQISVICSRDLREKVLFELWQDLICGRYRTPGYNSESGLDDKYGIGYYSDYVGTAEITQYDEAGVPAYRCKLIEAWPEQISPLQGNWGADEPQRLIVAMTYRHFEDVMLPPSPTRRPPLNFGLSDIISSAAQVGATIKSFGLNDKDNK